MRRAVRGTLGVIVGAAVMTAIAALSRVPYAAEPDGRALLRLSWRARGEALASCRRATDAELAGVPAHMRQDIICEGDRIAAYRLVVSIDGRQVLNEIARGSGVPGDRPIYVLEEFDVAPGPHRFSVRFAKESRAEGDDPATGAPDESSSRQPRRRAVPPLLDLDTALVVPERAVLLVTYDSERRQLVLFGGDPHS